MSMFKDWNVYLCWRNLWWHSRSLEPVTILLFNNKIHVEIESDSSPCSAAWEQYAVLHLTRCSGISYFVLSTTPKNNYSITTRSFVSWHNCRLGIISRRLSTISLDQNSRCITKHIYQYYFGTTVYVRPNFTLTQVVWAVTQPPYRNYSIYKI